MASTQFSVVFSCLLVICASYKEDQQKDLPQCNQPHEILSCVQDCPPARTCKNREIQFNCLLTRAQGCQLRCVCEEGYFRNSIGECITKTECDMCRGAHEFYSCGSECDNVCANLSAQNRTNCLILNIQCNRQCYCEDGFARDHAGNCVSAALCNKKQSRAACRDPNEEYVSCKRTCPPEHCISLVARFKCDSKVKCQPGCACKPGFLREKKDSFCIPICNCPQMKNSPDCILEDTITSFN